MLTKTLAFSLLALAACATAAQAQTTVLDNISTAHSSKPFTGTTNGTMVAEAFVTGGAITTLADVMFPQINLVTDSNGMTVPSSYVYGYGASETFSLYTNSAGTPGASLLNFILTPGSASTTTPSSSTNGEQTVATVPSDAASQVSATLTPNTQYWLVLKSNTTAAVSWDYFSDNSYLNNGSGYSIPSSGTVSTVTHADGSTATFATGAQQVYLSVVPEPSTYCLMAVAGLALVVSRKRKLA